MNPGLQIAYAAIDKHRRLMLDHGNADMATAATYAACHYDTFRKTWRDLVRDQAFPAPFRERPYYWRIATLDAWREDQERKAAARLRGLDVGRPANDTRPSPPAGGRVTQQRRRLMERMG